ncbi:hypothetical protein [Lichenifustis flavocetrariae]|uniref:Uncharacterized protein n=1 Tax=Lichenifustis flavocetrariae TaxID=2949735 RepID=A0AA41Z083_9HYPH|nr:hypothetical protein [Lichenifustis flavocetrariae]MCW6506927.1 hypothetical protein [Lichenifustis flavocetrariae]
MLVYSDGRGHLVHYAGDRFLCFELRHVADPGEAVQGDVRRQGVGVAGRQDLVGGADDHPDQHGEPARSARIEKVWVASAKTVSATARCVSTRAVPSRALSVARTKAGLMVSDAGPSDRPVPGDGRLVPRSIADDPTRSAEALTVYAAHLCDRPLGRAGTWLLDDLRKRFEAV